MGRQEPSYTSYASTKARSRPTVEDAEYNPPSQDSSGEECEGNGIRCLFCAEEPNDLDGTLEHMTEQHKFYIPEVENLSSVESLLKYLRTVIGEYHECLYCGITKDSASGIRRHMLDKDHCLINLKREPELLEFWDLSDSSDLSSGDEEILPSSRGEAKASNYAGQRLDPDQDEHTLPSGKVVRSKTKAREAQTIARRNARKLRDISHREQTHSIEAANTDPLPGTSELVQTETQGRPKELAVSTRDAVGLIGVSNQQLRSLVTIQRKMQRQEAVVRASAAWADELGGRSQKHGKVKMDLRSG